MSKCLCTCCTCPSGVDFYKTMTLQSIPFITSWRSCAFTWRNQFQLNFSSQNQFLKSQTKDTLHKRQAPRDAHLENCLPIAQTRHLTADPRMKVFRCVFGQVWWLLFFLSHLWVSLNFAQTMLKLIKQFKPDMDREAFLRNGVMPIDLNIWICVEACWCSFVLWELHIWKRERGIP